MQTAVDVETHRGGRRVHGCEGRLPPGSPPRVRQHMGRRVECEGRKEDALGGHGTCVSPVHHRPTAPSARSNHQQNAVTNHGTTLMEGTSTRHGLHQCTKHNHEQNRQSRGWEPTQPGWKSKINHTTFSFSDPPEAASPPPRRELAADLVPQERGQRHIRSSHKGYTTA
eukprot:TRINITY_DN3782_c0_g1_i1.p3 TRINITY_DN3782_c0_g1~~TRINITY_DN3782_c0_g1_i1.p3  ORF type:complete len:186 (+),score=49.02 TRINITY_DN3782_c0_g1_i1:53-559(+)